MDRVAGPGEDDLSTVLREVKVRSVVYCLSDFAAPWGFSVEHSPVAKFHVLLHGAAALTVGDAAPVPLRTGDLVVLPHGDGHVITDQPGSPVRQLDAIVAENPVDETGRLSYGGDGAQTRLLCGGFELDPALPDELAEFLPAVLTLDSSTGLVRWLEPLFAFLKEEAPAAPGAAAIFAKLSDVFVTQALRSYLVAADGLAPRTVTDPGIARIVKMLRARPEGNWSVSAMASSAGMSRTSFITRFRAAVGEPPMAYLTELRLRRAAGYLATTTKSVREIAHLTGYGDEASFSKAFSRMFGRPPGQYRRERLAAPQLGE
ncbi:MAG TPA: AraC family transcriptional regulator [Trebonia sp.]|nr:AraC family transcriptional regulator [Trebonia sp.]